MHTITFNAQFNLDKFMAMHKGYLYRSFDSKSRILNELDQLEDGGTYVLGNPYFDAIANERQHRQVEAKVLEEESKSAVIKFLGKGAHIHPIRELKDESGNSLMEIDGLIIHEGGHNVVNSSVYIVECGFNPALQKVQDLLPRLEKFKGLVKHNPHFSTTTNFYPVFGARQFSPAVNEFCKRNSIWQVRPSGGGYEVVRNLSTLVRRILK